MSTKNDEIVAIEGWAQHVARPAVSSITEVAKRRFGLTYGARMKRRWFFGEREPG